MTPTDQNNDNDLKKGAIEDEAPGEKNMTSMAGQLGHRDEDPMIKSADSDFPEPGESPEHSGEIKEPNQKDKDTLYGRPSQPGRNPEGNTQTPEPGDKQKNNQGHKKDDLAA
jgi:hypothetical protein